MHVRILHGPGVLRVEACMRRAMPVSQSSLRDSTRRAPGPCKIRTCMLCTAVRYMSTASHNDYDMFRGAWSRRGTGLQGPRPPAEFRPARALSRALGLTPALYTALI